MIDHAILLTVMSRNRKYLVRIIYTGANPASETKYMKKGDEIGIPLSEEIGRIEYTNEIQEVKGFDLKGKTFGMWIYVLSKPGADNYIKIKRSLLA